MLSKLAELWIDSVGALSAGIMTRVDCTIGHDANAAWKKVTAPVCRGDTYETNEGEVLQLAIPVTLKFKLGDTLQQRIRAAFVAGTECGILVSTGPKATTDHETITFNALVDNYNLKAQTGTHQIIEVTFTPHSASTTAPAFAIVA